jgi:hypothetical protein
MTLVIQQFNVDIMRSNRENAYQKSKYKWPHEIIIDDTIMNDKVLKITICEKVRIKAKDASIDFNCLQSNEKSLRNILIKLCTKLISLEQ